MNLEDKLRDIEARLASASGCKHVIIWGAGEHTDMLFKYTGIGGLSIKAIVDQAWEKVGKTMFGKKVLHPEEVDWGAVDCVVISSLKYQKEIKERLINFRIPGGGYIAAI